MIEFDKDIDIIVEETINEISIPARNESMVKKFLLQIHDWVQQLTNYNHPFDYKFAVPNYFLRSKEKEAVIRLESSLDRYSNISIFYHNNKLITNINDLEIFFADEYKRISMTKNLRRNYSQCFDDKIRNVINKKLFKYELC